MLNRGLMHKLRSWSKNKYRKPLVLRGARQVGKTTLVNMFSESFEQYVYLNLELSEDAAIFSKNNSIEQVIQAIFFLKGKSAEKQTLVFIDEIQNSPRAVALLRYFYETRPDLYIIAAGSLLETLLDVSVSFPVGRVEFMVVHPFTFEEYLWAAGENQAA
ncbi:MAG: AAA family ATPase, partial [Deltaproteobacteria bacterium]|nr:AAA family ATPase [Deltaproteobacteria bacterium]